MLSLQQYDYTYPDDLIAQAPTKPRDSAKLLIYDPESHEIIHTTYRQLAKYAPAGSVLVFNQTKVMPARLPVKKSTGGAVELLILEISKAQIKVIANKKLVPEQTLVINSKYQFKVKAKQDRWYWLEPLFAMSKLEKIMQQYGQAPLPPYIKKSPLTPAQAKTQYQTVFAKQLGSSAAPTASLHFTNRLLDSLRKHRIQIEFVTLHVGLGTFAPVTAQQVKNKKLHKEYYEIDQQTMARLNKAKQSGQPIIAVGTTVVRTLESASHQTNRLKTAHGTTDLFLQPNSARGFVDGLITNFHVPQSSLMMLVANFIGQKTLLALYHLAISLKYRLFSFGDGMFILPKQKPPQ